MAQIRCANCGESHASVADVRACFATDRGAAGGGLPAPDAVAAGRSPFAPTDPDDDGGWREDGWLEEIDRFSDADGEPATGWDGGHHDTVASPRADRAPRPRGRRGQAPPPSGPGRAAAGARPRPRPVATRRRSAPWFRPASEWAGPAALGRGLVVAPGGAVAPPWSDAVRLTFGPGAGPAASSVDDLAACWAGRRRFVVTWHGPVPGPSEEPYGGGATELRVPWELGVGFELSEERIAVLITAHAVDSRSPEGARYHPAELALTAGARVPAGAAPGHDVEGPDGTPLVIDGGPLVEQVVEGATVVPLAFVEAGRLTPIGSASPSADLAPDQLAAVAHPGGGARIIAPAGSGKTRVLTERARLLLAGRGLPPSLLTLIAFNVRAADEMRERTADLPELHIRTLNSLGLAIANGTAPFAARSGGGRLSTIDETETRRILEGLVRFPRRAGTDPAAVWLEALSAVRLGLRDPQEVETAFGGDVDGLVDVLPRYREELARRGALDFDEQIIVGIERLLREPQARRQAQLACRVLLVDEFQDLAPAHLLLVRLLAAPTYDCFGVGDDDQTIYGYAGASPDWLVRFDRWFPAAADHPLQVNYRCAPAVVTAAANLLTRNRQRVHKDVRPAPGRAGEPGDLLVQRVADVAAQTCAEVERLVAGGVDPGDVAVLTRVNVTLLPVQLRLAAAGVPTTAPVDAQLLQRSGVRAALAWLALAAAGADGSGTIPAGQVADAARRPPRGLSPKLVEWMGEQRSVDGLRRLGGRLSNARDADKVDAFAADVELVSSLVAGGADTATVLRAVADRLGLGAAMDTLDRSRGTVDRSAHGDDLAALEAVAHLHPDPAGFGAWLRRQLTGSGRVASPTGVHLATVHRVKGREWPHVIVHDASAGLLPHRLAVDVEEERRVFHVGLTRSMVRTVVVADAAQPSPFLDELDTPGAPPPLSPKADAGRSRSASGTAAAGAPATAGGGGAGTADQATVDGLKAWRRERSRTDGVPAYVVLPDKAIDDIARRRPTSLAELARCHGIGPAKLERYGDEVIAVLDGLR